uniref:Uncharacterized protein n=1 Tax=Hemiselmis andersenii TaxID=464988 RepID=A0A6U4J839_HEMAN|mmetsp:Transcript_11874/g.27481  ORF Transcript_11874/g.27481 Transcript_11874/m.27481 type:complete len:253 (+) Transcript_11874:227-985(+)|eukprot:CAMPEP_0114134946 /NCGR_PEP_ID=MMETSP0043_2-20121206/14442_1 /TAXON_ID=464988 /ORGANISM="Hemiselmis andersenii, Strain CCMP644" /LENGTH=252 /DNA_ID=CAMNT_0001228647 /DNA_START=191 /DNA_END=949 /DNA_ORIENTATION=-
MGKGMTAPEENLGTKKLLGTFTAPPPLCLGEPYVGRNPKDARIQGKQMTSGALKHENSKVNPGTFEPPKLLWSEQKDRYQDCIRYKDIVPPERKKNGFLSSDYPRRDEFSNTIRTEQLREILKKETAKMREAKESALQRDTQKMTADQILANTSPTKAGLAKPPLYDVVYRIPEASLKLARDDRQAGLWYRNERIKAMKGIHDEKKKLIDGTTWVNISVNGKLLNVLVDEEGHVLGQKNAVEAVVNSGSGLD